MPIGFGNLTDLLSQGLITSTFGSPVLAGFVLMGFLAFIMLRYHVSLDGIMVVLGVTLLTLSLTIFDRYIFISMVMGMLMIVGIAMLKVFKR